jgi:O-antigen/teichoic acid export membrane protein
MQFKKEIILSYFFQAGNVAISFLTTIILTKLLSQSDWGNYSLFQNLGLMGSIIGGLSLPSAVIYFVASSKIDPAKILFNFSVFQLVFSVLIVLFVFIFNNNVSNKLFLLKISNYYLLLFLYLSLLMINNIVTSVMRGVFMFNYINFILFIANFLLFAFYGYYYFLGRSKEITIENAITLLLSTAALQFFINLFFLSRKLIFNKSIIKLLNYSEIKSILIFISMVYLANVLQIFVYKIDTWILYKYSNSATTAVYALAVTVAQTTWLFATAISTILFSVISKEANNNFNNTVSQYLRFSFYITFLLGIMLTIVVYFFAEKIFGAQYKMIIYIIPILLVGIIPFSIAIVFGSFAAGINKNILNLFGSLISFIVVIVLDLILIPKYQYWGAAFATMIAYLTSTIFCISIFWIKYRISLNSYLNPTYLYNDFKKLFNYTN